nr:MAG TPA: hypothetical protein [Microviridae sp.]
MPTTPKYSVADNFHVSSNSFHVCVTALIILP